MAAGNAERLRHAELGDDVSHEPLPRHRAFWTGAVNEEIAAAYARFMELRESVLFLAYEVGLAENARARRPMAARRQAFDNFYDELRAAARQRVQAQPSDEE